MIKTCYKFMGHLELPSLGNRRNRREEACKGIAVKYAPNAQSHNKKSKKSFLLIHAKMHKKAKRNRVSPSNSQVG